MTEQDTPAQAHARTLARRCVEPPRWESGELIIRRYDRSDHAAVLALHRTALAEVGLRPGDGIYYDDDLDRIEEIYLRGGGDFLVGEIPCSGEGLVAMGGLRAVRSDDHVRPAPGAVAEMVRLRVHPRWQRRGHGGALVLAIEERARELGYRVLRGDTTERQRAALSLYGRSGWRETGRRVIGGIVNIYGEKRLT